jgi:beta-xylosidase
MHELLHSRFLTRTRDGSFVLFDANSPAASNLEKTVAA